MSQKPTFHDDYRNPQQDPLNNQTTDFDWDRLYELLGEAEQEVEERDYDKLTFAIRRLLEFMLADDLRHPKAERNIVRRVVALAWTLNPGYFEGSPSLTEVAHMMGLNKVTLSEHTAEVRRVFGVRNRAQSHGWNFKAQKEVA
jgi:hypothetical protein